LEIVFWQIKLGGGEINQAGYKKGPAQRVAKKVRPRSVLFSYTFVHFFIFRSHSLF